MPEPSQYTFTLKELAEMMVREVGVKEGIWGIQVRFGLAAGNIGSSPDDLRPTAMVPLVEMGLQRFDRVSNIAVDAAEVWKKRSEVGVAVAREQVQPEGSLRRRRPAARSEP